MSITDKKPVAQKTCPICGESFPARGIHGHIRQAHGADKAEAWRIANRIAVNKELEAKHPRSTGEVVQALADPGSVLSGALNSPESAPPSIQQKRAVELSNLKKKLKSVSGGPRFLRGKNAAEIALEEVEKAEEKVKRDLKKASSTDAQRKEEVDKAEENVKRDLKKASPTLDEVEKAEENVKRDLKKASPTLDEVEKAEENVKRDLKKASPIDARKQGGLFSILFRKRDLKKASPTDAPCEPSMVLPIDWFRGKNNPGTPDNATISAVAIKPNKFFEKILKIISSGVIGYIIAATLLSGKNPGKPSGGFKVRGLENLSKFHQRRRG